MSKGSRPRPFSVTQQEYDNRWDAIFGKDLNDEPVSPSPSPVDGLKLQDSTVPHELNQTDK